MGAAKRSIRAEDIYEGLFDDEAFGRLPGLLAQAGNARSALMQWRHHDGAFEVLASSYFSKDQMARYPAFAATDPWLRVGLRPDRQNKITLMDDHVSSGAYENSMVYNELARALGDDTFHCMGVAVVSPWGTGVLGVHRGRSSAPFGSGDAARWAKNLEHFKKVLRVRGEIASASRAGDLARGALDTVAVAAIVVRSDLRVMHANVSAEAVLRHADGLTCRNGGLTAATKNSSERLAGAVARATASFDPAPSAFFVERGPDEPGYLVTVAPLAGRVRALALVLLRDPAKEDDSVAWRLRSLFGLTGVEALIAADLGRGCTALEIARRRGVQTNTLKTQLRSLAGKMNCSRQSEIAAIAAALPPLRASR